MIPPLEKFTVLVLNRPSTNTRLALELAFPMSMEVIYNFVDNNYSGWLISYVGNGDEEDNPF